jgi:membrane protease YdiL (CAAX protease family)
MVCEQAEQLVKSQRLPPPRHSFEERISSVRVWTVLPAVLLPVIAWDQLGPHTGGSEVASPPFGDLILWASAFAWWFLMAAPRPYSLRASLGRPLDLAGWRIVALALFGDTGVRMVWWLSWYCRDIFQVASTTGAYTFHLPHTHVDASYMLSAGVLAPLVEELLFRGTLFRNLRVRFNSAVAVLASSALFGLGHKDQVGAFISALCFALVYTRTRSLWAPIALHALNNGAWLLLSKYYLGDSPQVRLEGPWQLGAFALVVLVGVAVCVQFVCKSWRTLGDPLPPDSLQASAVENSPSLPEPVRAGP